MSWSLEEGRAKARAIDRRYTQVSKVYKHPSLMPRRGIGATTAIRKQIARKRNGGGRHAESKFIDANRTTSDITVGWTNMAPSGGITGCLSTPAQGVGESDHLARTYYLQSVFIRGTVRLVNTESLTAPPNEVEWRVIMVLDKQTNATAILGPNVMDISAINDVLSYKNLQNSERFQVLWDSGRRFVRPQFVNLGAPDLFAMGETRVPFQGYHIFKKPIKVRTVTNDANVTSVADNSVSLIGTANTTGVGLGFDSRCRFTETI